MAIGKYLVFGYLERVFRASIDMFFGILVFGYLDH